MRVTITIDTDNAAFHPEEGGQAVEVARILQRLAASFREAYAPLAKYSGQRLHDVNGNHVGVVKVHRSRARGHE